ncbi:MAG TPA: alpha/beta fold hydrolase [Kofleriaceae bacterium]|jgi:pimeloyl-ACP methyl ester carboxylesterase
MSQSFVMTSPEPLRVRSGGVDLAAWRWRGRGTPIVLVHGYPDTHDVWARVVEHLPGRDVIAYDVRTSGDFSLAQLADDLFAVIDAIGGPVHVVGHDWGGIQAWEAVTDPRATGRIERFTAISGPCLDHVGFALREQPARRIAAQLARSWYIWLFHVPGAPLAVRAFGRRYARQISLYRTNIFPRLARPRIRTTQLPVQLLVATKDRFVGAHLADGVERWAPNLTRIDVPGGHWLPRTHAPAVAGAITRFGG